MFVYLKMTTDKLQPWSDFWKEIPEALMPADPEELKASLDTIEHYDTQATEFYDSAKKIFDYFSDRRNIFLGKPTNHGKQTTAFGNEEKLGSTTDLNLDRPERLIMETARVFLSKFGPEFIGFIKLAEQHIDENKFPENRQFLLEKLEACRIIARENENVLRWIHSVLEMKPKFEGDDSAFKAIAAGLANLDNHLRLMLEFNAGFGG